MADVYSKTSQDVPLLEPVQILQTRIKSTLWGYDRRVVNRLLEDITASYERLWFRVEAADAEAAALRARVEEADKHERLISAVLLEAHSYAKLRREQAEADAEAIRADARVQATNLLVKSEREQNRLMAQLTHLRALHDQFMGTIGGLAALVSDEDDATLPVPDAAGDVAVEAQQELAFRDGWRAVRDATGTSRPRPEEHDRVAVTPE